MKDRVARLLRVAANMLTREDKEPPWSEEWRKGKLSIAVRPQLDPTFEGTCTWRKAMRVVGGSVAIENDTFPETQAWFHFASADELEEFALMLLEKAHEDRDRTGKGKNEVTARWSWDFCAAAERPAAPHT